MGALRDVHEDAVQEEQEQLQIQVLAPAQAQVEEELRKPFVLDKLDLLLDLRVVLGELSAVVDLLQALLVLVLMQVLIVDLLDVL